MCSERAAAPKAPKGMATRLGRAVGGAHPLAEAGQTAGHAEKRNGQAEEYVQTILEGEVLDMLLKWLTWLLVRQKWPKAAVYNHPKDIKKDIKRLSHNPQQPSTTMDSGCCGTPTPRPGI